MKVFYLNDLNNNAGDMISEPILRWLGVDNIELENRKYRGKLLAVGSIMSALRRGDSVWGSGCIRHKQIIAPPNTTFIAIRGKKTKRMIRNAFVPNVFGDPALLLPLIYNPVVEKKHKIGILPHFIDKEIARPIAEKENYHFIDIQTNWKSVIDEIKSCEKIISSTLHGIIFSEAYNIPVVWAKYSDNIIGGEFKFQDYFSGTYRKEQSYFKELDKLENIKDIQKRLIDSFYIHFNFTGVEKKCII